MRVGCWLLGVVAIAGCGGHSTREPGAEPAMGGATAAAGTTSTGGTATAGTTAAPSLVPDDPQVSTRGDGRVTGGSFEGSLGAGWDFCCVTALQARVTDAAGGVVAVDGDVYLGFDSSGVGAPIGGTCPDSQVAFWVDGMITDPQLALYFDVRNLGLNEPSGTLQIDAMQRACVGSEALATIPLDSLDAKSTWQTRCVTLEPKQSFQAFGLKLSGAPYHLGFDAFRFGPPCHAR